MYRCNVSLPALCLLRLSLPPSNPIIAALITLHFKSADKGARNLQVNSDGTVCSTFPLCCRVLFSLRVARKMFISLFKEENLFHFNHSI